jgi:hypothetical protein
MGAPPRTSNVPNVEGSEDALDAPLLDVVHEPRSPRSRGERTVSALLPNGRTAWLTIDPSIAPVEEINRVATALQRIDARHALNIGAESDAITNLARKVAKDMDRVAAARVAGDKKLRRKLAAGDAKLRKQASVAIAKDRALTRKEWKDMHTQVRRMRRRSVWDHVVVASAVPLFATFGQRGKPFGINNITLFLSLLVWLVGDEINDLISGPPREQGAGPFRDLDIWSYLAPVGNVLTGWWLLDSTQRDRFVTGTEENFLVVQPPLFVLASASSSQRRVKSTYIAQIDLTTRMASGHVDDFRTYTNVPAVATITTATLRPELQGDAFTIESLTARVDMGILTITIVADVGPSRFGLTRRDHAFSTLAVAWLVDAKAPDT